MSYCKLYFLNKDFSFFNRSFGITSSSALKNKLLPGNKNKKNGNGAGLA